MSLSAPAVTHIRPGHTETRQRVLAVMSSTNHEGGETEEERKMYAWSGDSPFRGSPPPLPRPEKGARDVTKERQGTTIATHLVEFRDHGQLKLTHDEGSKRVQGDGKEGERNTGMKHTAGEYLCCSSKGCMLHITGQQLCQVQLSQAHG